MLPHIGKMHIHCITAGKIFNHALHQMAKAAVAQWFIIENDQQRSNKVAHTLHIANLKMLPNVPNRNDDEQEK